MNVLYLSYDGLTDPLGQSQILPYLSRLSRHGFKFTVISCEKEAGFRAHGENIRLLLREYSIDWVPITYTKNPPVLSTVWDIRKIRRTALRLHQEKQFALVHCRSYITAFVGLQMKRAYNIPFIFDMRGFWANERVEGGLWNKKNPLYNLIYRYFKYKEGDFLAGADCIISLTHKAKAEIQSWKSFSNINIKVIPCCVDTALFDREHTGEEKSSVLRQKLSIHRQDFVITYLGALGTWYMLPEMLDFFSLLLQQRPEAKFLFITPENPAHILKVAAEKGIPAGKLCITSAPRKDVPALLSLSDAGLFFIRPVYSKLASSPTKLGELMSMGIPVITNKKIGDMEEILLPTGAGLFIDDFSTPAYERAIAGMDNLLKTDREKIRRAAKESFSLEKGVDTYLEAYQSVIHS